MGWTLLAGVWLAKTQSLTTDEGIHVASAYLALTRGEHRFDPEHPYLFKYLTALPLLPLNLNLPAEDASLWAMGKPTFYDSWQESREWSDQWFYQSNNPAELMTWLSRLPGVACLLALVWLLYYVGKRWFNDQIGLWAAFLASFSPVLLAHGSLTNTDVPLSLTILLALYLFWTFFQNPSKLTALWFGLSIGISLTTKFTGVLLIPLGLFWLIYTARQKKLRWQTSLLYGVIATGTIWLWIWLIYFGQSPLQPIGAPPTWQLDQVNIWFESHGTSLTAVIDVLRHLLPSAFVKGMIFSLAGSAVGRSAFILGQEHFKGVWYYFPILLLLKTQLILLLILLIGSIRAALSLRHRPALTPLTVLLLASGGLILLLSLTSKLNLGIRHLSGFYPLLMLFLAYSIYHLLSWLSGRWALFATGLIIALTVLPVWFGRNNLLGYTNALVYPPARAWWYMGDSNIDWGQQAQT
ncbi:MAG: glycosyltransferase family 39 protein, partial [Methanothrix sp.]